MNHLLRKAVLGAGASMALLPAGTALAAGPTITAAPNPTTSGDPVVIYGAADPGAKVVLWHRINPAAKFTPIQKTTADTAGRYEFTRADGVVTTNRNWYVIVNGHRSNTVHEKVSALVTVNGPADPNLTTGTPYTYTGTVSPAHGGERVALQRQSASGNADSWHTIDSAKVAADGSYTINHKYTSPGDANIRVHFVGDRRNVASDSDVLAYDISQKQHPNLTIASSADPIAEGGTTDISGTLAGVTAATRVTLFGHVSGRGFSPIATTTTDAAGNYTFAGQQPVSNTLYQVRGNGKKSAQLFEGVHDVVTAMPSATSLTAGDTLTVSGAVSPDKSGHVIYLERQNANGKGWHAVQKTNVAAGSSYTFTRRVTSAGTKVFRVLITGGPVNQGGASAPFTVTVAAAVAPLT
jgi:hypothetical protein